MVPIRCYDERALRGRLAHLERPKKTAFAAACAERLWPLFKQYAAATGKGDVEALARILSDTWRAASGEQVDLSQAQSTAEAMVPSEDEPWVHERSYGQNSAACTAYAVRTWATDDPQEAAWAALQVYEAADYAAQRMLGEWDPNGPNAERQILKHPIVQNALSGIAVDLSAVESIHDHDWASVRRRAREEGETWARSLP